MDDAATGLVDLVPSDMPRADHEFVPCGHGAPKCLIKGLCHHAGMADYFVCGLPRSAHPRPEPAEREPCDGKDAGLGCDCGKAHEPEPAGDPLGEMARQVLDEMATASLGRSSLNPLPEVPILRAAFERLVRECAGLCRKRAKQQRSEAQSLVEHYGQEADQEASMYDADAIGADALEKAILARYGLKESVADTPEPLGEERAGMKWLLNRIASLESPKPGGCARWDQWLRWQFGDERADMMIAAIEARYGLKEQP